MEFTMFWTKGIFNKTLSAFIKNIMWHRLFMGWIFFLSPNQHCQSNGGMYAVTESEAVSSALL